MSVRERGAAPSAQTLHRAAGAVVCLVNADRARHGLRALRRDSDLRPRRAASLSEHGPAPLLLLRDSKRWLPRPPAAQRIHPREAGPARRRGTRLASGTRSTPAAIVAGWIASPTQSRILLGRDPRDVGVGVAAGDPAVDHRRPWRGDLHARRRRERRLRAAAEEAAATAGPRATMWLKTEHPGRSSADRNLHGLLPMGWLRPRRQPATERSTRERRGEHRDGQSHL